MSLNIAIAGAAGRMGRALTRAFAADGFAIVGGSVRPGSPDNNADIGALAGLDPLGATVSDNVALAAANADAWIDFTLPDATLGALATLKNTRVKTLIIGTTGLDAAQQQAIESAASRFVIVKSGNFSLGVNLLAALAEQTAARLGKDWDVEILEVHHRHKRDAPSGTALMLGDAVAKGRGGTLANMRAAPREGASAPRAEGTIGFAIQRAGGVIGEHEVAFASEKEILRLSHQALDRGLFADGARAAAKWAADKPPGLYSMRDVLGL